MILVDSNVLIDIIDRNSIWFDWSATGLKAAVLDHDLFINPVVVAEVAPRFFSLQTFLMEMASLLVRVEPLEAEASFLAGEAFQRYRDRKQPNQAKSILADFFIGGHAQSAGALIMTRDPRFYRTYFPDLPLITPETHP